MGVPPQSTPGACGTLPAPIACAMRLGRKSGPARSAMIRDLIITVVVPVRDRADYIAPFLDRLDQVLERSFASFEVIVVDDGSVDGTGEVIRSRITRQPSLRLLVLSRSYGHEIAVTAGLDHAIGDFVAVVSGELHDPVEMLPALVERAREGADVVYVRTSRFSVGEGLAARTLARLFYWASRRLTGLEVREDASDFQLLSRRVVNSLTRLKEHNRVLGMLVAYVGHKAVGVDPPAGGQLMARTWPGLRKRLHRALDATIAFSDRPIRYASAFSLGVSLLALLGVVAVIAEHSLTAGLPSGWASLMVTQLGMFSLLFLVLAVLSEYVARIMTESKQRPLYYVREEIGGTRLDIDNIVDVG